MTLLPSIAVSHSLLKIKIITIWRPNVPLSTKEPGGTRGVTDQISMACIVVEITPPMLME